MAIPVNFEKEAQKLHLFRVIFIYRNGYLFKIAERRQEGFIETAQFHFWSRAVLFLSTPQRKEGKSILPVSLFSDMVNDF